MKSLFKLVLLSSFITATSACPNYYLERQVKQPSRDRRLEISKVEDLALGDSIYNSYGEVIFLNDYQDQEIEYYKATGSEHSGWFELALIVDKNTCSILKEITVYSE